MFIENYMNSLDIGALVISISSDILSFNWLSSQSLTYIAIGDDFGNTFMHKSSYIFVLS